MGTYLREVESNYGRVSEAEKDISPDPLIKKNIQIRVDNVTVQARKDMLHKKVTLLADILEKNSFEADRAPHTSNTKPRTETKRRTIRLSSKTEVNINPDKNKGSSNEKKSKRENLKEIHPKVVSGQVNRDLFTIKENVLAVGEETMSVPAKKQILSKKFSPSKLRPQTAGIIKEAISTPSSSPVPAQSRAIQLKPYLQKLNDKPQSTPKAKAIPMLVPKVQEIKAIDIRENPARESFGQSPSSKLSKDKSRSANSRPFSASEEKVPTLKALLALKYRQKEASLSNIEEKSKVLPPREKERQYSSNSQQRKKTQPPSIARLPIPIPTSNSIIKPTAQSKASNQGADFQIRNFRMGGAKAILGDRPSSKLGSGPSISLSTAAVQSQDPPGTSDRKLKPRRPHKADSQASLSRQSSQQGFYKAAQIKDSVTMYQDIDSGSKKHSLEHSMLNLLHGVYIRPRSSNLAVPVRFNVCEGNNGRLVETMIRAKDGVVYETNYSKCNIQWSQTYHKSLVATSLKFSPRIQYRDLNGKEEFNALNLLDADTVNTQFLDLKLFRISSSKIMRELFASLIKTGQLVYLIPEGVNLVNHLRGINCIGHKTKLTETIIRFAKNRRTDPFTIIPRTYLVRLQSFESDIERVSAAKKKDEGFVHPLIVKPGENSNRGQGIIMAYSLEETIQAALQILRGRKTTNCAIVQWYISAPLLYQRRKFDIRCYGLVVKFSNRTMFYWYLDGYARTSSFEYSADKGNLMVHLTNEAIQVKGTLP